MNHGVQRLHQPKRTLVPIFEAIITQKITSEVLGYNLFL